MKFQWKFQSKHPNTSTHTGRVSHQCTLVVNFLLRERRMIFLLSDTSNNFKPANNCINDPNSKIRSRWRLLVPFLKISVFNVFGTKKTFFSLFFSSPHYGIFADYCFTSCHKLLHAIWLSDILIIRWNGTLSPNSVYNGISSKEH